MTSSSARCSRATATSRAGSSKSVRNNHLASPPLCVAYALAGRMDVDLDQDPLGEDGDEPGGTSPTSGRAAEEIRPTIAEAVRQDMFERSRDVFTGDERWLALETLTATPLLAGVRVDLRARASCTSR